MFYTTVLFDLDGTLIESGPGILAVARAVLREIGWPDQPDEAMLRMVGPPLINCYTDILKVPMDRLLEALELHRELSKTIGMDQVKPYPGIPELLARLHAAGAFIGVVTSRVTPTAKALVQQFGLAASIDFVRGGTPGAGAEKLPILLETLEELRADRARTVMVGDRHFDLLAANQAGVDSIGVTYGYGTAQEIASCNPTHTASNADDLQKLLLTHL